MLFKVVDPRGKVVSCTKDQWENHVLPRRPNMERCVELIKETIKLPDLGVFKDAKKTNRNVYYRFVKARNLYLKVVVEFIDDGRNNNRFKRKNIPLKYSHLQNYSRVARLSEPFLTPLITHILTSINGYGVPDYPDDIKNDIKNLFPGITP